MKKLFIILYFFSFFTFGIAKETATSSFAIDYLNNPEKIIYVKYNSTNVVNTELSFSDYSSYLQDAFKEIPFSKILYTQSSYLWSTGNMIFLFDDYSISSVVFQTIQNENDFKKIVDAHYERFGAPKYRKKQEGISRFVWETNTGNILLSHTVRPLGYTVQNMITETPNPGFAFIELDNVNFNTSLGIWRPLKENNIIDINGVALNKDLDKNLSQLDQTLSPLNLSSMNIQKIKVMLLSTTFGETNILYLNKNNGLNVNSTEDEDFDFMLQ